MKGISIRELLSYRELQLQIIAGEKGLDNRIQIVDINRPGLALVGFYENFAFDRLQVIGKGEYSYINRCGIDEQTNIIKTFLSYRIPAILFTHDNDPPHCFLEEAELHSVPILKTTLSTHDFQMKYFSLMTELLAEETYVHGVLLDVFGVGLLIQGESGIGKSETAIELIERGHRLIADDVVKIKAISENTLFGYTNDDIEYHMELRGIGIINIKDLYGIRSTRKKIQIDLAVQLLEWQTEQQDFDRLGIKQEYIEILKVKIPRISIPVRPGRNIPILIETAAMNYRLRSMGYDPAINFLEKMEKKIHQKKNYHDSYSP